MNQQNLKYQLLADLLATLEAEEFPIGVGKHLELQQLYSMLPEEIAAEEMKTLLAPIFAKNKQDQEFFYDIFDQSLSRIKSKTWEPKDQPITPILPPKSKWEIITRLLGIALLSIAAFLIYLRFAKEEPAPRLVNNFPVERIKVKEDTTYSINLLEYDDLKDSLSQLITNDSLPLFISFENGDLVGAIPDVGNYQIDSLGNFTLKTEDEISLFSNKIRVTSNYRKGEINYDLNFYGGEKVVESKENDFLEFREHPYPKDLSQLFPMPPPVWITYYQKYKYWIKPILIFLLFAMFGAYFSWYAERQQKIIADIQSKNDPPLLWNIQIPNVSTISLNEDYFKVLQLMRQRTSDDHYVLNIPKTINKTIEKGGIIDFQYQYKTRPPEYLLLIDRQSSKNHRAYLYNYLFESFRANEVYIERFFFEGDIRLCWNEYYPNGIKLQDLQQTFRDARLIIVGSGYQLLNPVTGKLAKWTRIFDNWPDRAILSPRPTKNWAGREKQLEQKFILLPASVQSLTAMVDKMEAIDPDEIKTKINDEVNEPIEFRGGLIETLQHYFSMKKGNGERDESLVHWIAACAIYPTLHWDLTMYLGQELSTEDKNLLTFDHINQLTRLPWFVEGKIPEQARLELLEYLPEDIELHLRKSLKHLFETIPPPNENSVAFADSRINISLNNYLLEKNNLLKTEIDQYARAGADIDVTMLKYLEGEKSPKDFEVDPNLRKYAEGEKPAMGHDRWSKFLSILLILMTIGIIAYNPSFEGCEGEVVPFKDLELCLSSPDDHLIYRAAQMRNYINQNKYNQIDSLEKEALKKYFLFNSGQRTVAEVGQVQQAGYSVESIFPFVKEDTSILHFYQNLAVDFYNHGIPFFNRFDSLTKSDQTYRNLALEASSLGTNFLDTYYQISDDTVRFCTAFEKAISYDKKFPSYSWSTVVEVILENTCRIVPTASPAIPKVINKDVLPRKVGGKVYDQKDSSTRLAGVTVEFLGQKSITNQRGRYEFDLPPNSTLGSFTFKFSKTNYDNISKVYTREDVIVPIERIDEPVDLPNVFMSEKTPEVANSCYKTKIAEYRRMVATEDYEIARKILEEAKRCDNNTTSESSEVNGEIKRIDKILDRIRNAGNPPRQDTNPIQPVDNSCYETKFAEYKELFAKEDYEKAKRILEEAGKCENLIAKDRLEIRKEIKKVEIILKRIENSGLPQESGKPKPEGEQQKQPVTTYVLQEIKDRINKGEPIKIYTTSSTPSLRAYQEYKVYVERKSNNFITSGQLNGNGGNERTSSGKKSNGYDYLNTEELNVAGDILKFDALKNLFFKGKKVGTFSFD
ncbi:MAG: hypothetical protein AB8F94_19105 [Saprospiraceae bacterium]